MRSRPTDADRAAEAIDSLRDRRDRLRPQTVSEVINRPPPSWLVHEVLPDAGVAVLYGASGSGKTFVALDLAVALVLERPFFGRRTRRTSVVYMAAEGRLGLRLRAVLSRLELEPDALAGLRVIPSGVDLLDPDVDVLALVDALREARDEMGRIGLMVIDTLNRVMPGGDENSSVDMGAAINAAQRIADAIECLVVFVHHSGKDEARGSRGHSSLKAATEAEICVRRDNLGRSLWAEKVRDAEDHAHLGNFVLESVDLGPVPDGEEGERLRSCVVVPAESATADADDDTKPRKLGKNQRKALEVLVSLENAQRATLERSGYESGNALVTLADWRKVCMTRGLTSNRFDEARKGLREHKLIQELAPHVLATPAGRVSVDPNSETLVGVFGNSETSADTDSSGFDGNSTAFRINFGKVENGGIWP